MKSWGKWMIHGALQRGIRSIEVCKLSDKSMRNLIQLHQNQFCLVPLRFPEEKVITLLIPGSSSSSLYQIPCPIQDGDLYGHFEQTRTTSGFLPALAMQECDHCTVPMESRGCGPGLPVELLAAKLWGRRHAVAVMPQQVEPWLPQGLAQIAGKAQNPCFSCFQVSVIN